jgi:hypothetical protein
MTETYRVCKRECNQASDEKSGGRDGDSVEVCVRVCVVNAFTKLLSCTQGQHVKLSDVGDCSLVAFVYLWIYVEELRNAYRFRMGTEGLGTI